MTKYFKAVVLENTALDKHFRLLTIDAGHSTLDAQRIPAPGQFYMLQAGDSYDPLLKRPFSIFRHKDNSLSFLYRIKGKGTLSLSHFKGGDTINVIGPLGSGYPEPRGDFIAVAGGIGIAPLLPLLDRFKNRAYLFYGARNKEELIMLDEAKADSKELFVTTEDGSYGQKGLITEVLKDFIEKRSRGQGFKGSSEKIILESSNPRTHESSLIYACGPTPMLKELSKVVAGRMGGVKCYVSLEEHMACGVGVCLGCVVKTVSGYQRVCKEGPVFDIKDIVWE